MTGGSARRSCQIVSVERGELRLVPPVRPVRFVRDLPPGRRETLLWRMSSFADFTLGQPLDVLEDLCQPWWSDDLPWVADQAVLDVWGVYHLVAGGRPVCVGGSVTRSCKDRVRGAVAEPVEEVWTVPSAQRCYRAATRWPPALDGTSARARLRRLVVEALGPRCATCPDWGRLVDHDHLTGLVRGYLCGSCNTLVDTCRHPAGCRFANYLNDPPALPLALSYPGWEGLLARPRQMDRAERFRMLREACDALSG
jgi:Recombination endonuclease VII